MNQHHLNLILAECRLKNDPASKALIVSIEALQKIAADTMWDERQNDTTPSYAALDAIEALQSICDQFAYLLPAPAAQPQTER